MSKISTFLMFVGKECGKAEEAINFYVSLFENSEIISIERWKKGEAGGEEGLVKHAVFTLSGQKYMASENIIKHKFNFTPSMSIYVECESESELDALFSKLSNEGEVLMPPDNYGCSEKFAWSKDKYGVSWQLNFKK